MDIERMQSLDANTNIERTSSENPAHVSSSGHISETGPLTKCRQRMTSVLERLAHALVPFVKPFLILVAIYLVAISSILFANFNYIDDMGRAATGYKQWDGFSRYSSDFLSTFVHAGNYLCDISPLPQLISVLVMAASGIVLIYILTRHRKISGWLILAAVPLMLTPYFLENVSYKFDSPYMALSVFAMIVPLLLLGRNRIALFAAVFAGTLIMCTTYQAASGILPMVAVASCFMAWMRGGCAKQQLADLVCSAASYLVAIVFFQKIMMKPADSYVSNSLPPLTELPETIAENLLAYYKLVASDFKTEWILLIVFLVLCFVVLSVMNTKKSRAITSLCAVGLAAFCCVAAFGLYIALDNPLKAPRAMYGLGAFVAVFAIASCSMKWSLLPKLATLALCWTFFVFAFVYGNALYVQEQWTDYRISLVAQDVSELEIMENGQTKKFQIDGSIGYAPTLRNQPQDYQMLNRLVPVTFRGSWTWGAQGFLCYYGLSGLSLDLTSDMASLDLPVLVETSYHVIYGDETHLLVELR